MNLNKTLWMQRLLIIVIFLSLPLRVSAQLNDDVVNDFESADQAKQLRAAKEISRSGKAALPALRKGLTNRNPETRIRYLWLMGSVKSPELLDNIKTAALNDNDWRVRLEAVSLIHKYRQKSSAAIFKEILKKEKNARTKSAALKLLSFYDGIKSSAAITASLTDTEPLVQLAAARELGRYHNSAGYEIALGYLKNKDWRVRGAAVEALGEIGSANALEALRVVGKDVNEPGYVRDAAEAAVQTINLKQFSEEKQLEYLRTSLSDDRVAIRRWAATALLRRGDPGAAVILKSAAENTEHKGRREAASAIQAMDSQGGL